MGQETVSRSSIGEGAKNIVVGLGDSIVRLVVFLGMLGGELGAGAAASWASYGVAERAFDTHILQELVNAYGGGDIDSSEEGLTGFTLPWQNLEVAAGEAFVGFFDLMSTILAASVVITVFAQFHDHGADVRRRQASN